ncbi:MAG: hypothetical protein PHH54_07030 [Candidatus Nanoarchaeia archaeon]|nr:hypothetical protein [Candidatus Nanoarchaeia archaeon]MDD5741708.1 hypothetical protein [Candidatus Nanoarchaeia archaeon]
MGLTDKIKKFAKMSLGVIAYGAMFPAIYYSLMASHNLVVFNNFRGESEYKKSLSRIDGPFSFTQVDVYRGVHGNIVSFLKHSEMGFKLPWSGQKFIWSIDYDGDKKVDKISETLFYSPGNEEVKEFERPKSVQDPLFVKFQEADNEFQKQFNRFSHYTKIE